MNKQDIINRVGLEKYQSAMRWFREDSARNDYGSNNTRDNSSSIDLTVQDLPHEIEDEIWKSKGSEKDRIFLFFSIYDDIPTYGLLMPANCGRYSHFSESDRALWWTQVCERLKGNDLAIQKPLLYGLWCDYFEDPKTVAEVWEVMVYSNHATPTLIQTILPYSGPVPYTLKRYLYRELLQDRAFHQAIFHSLISSVTDVYGSIDREDALHTLSQLHLNDRAAQTELEAILSKDD